MNPPPCTAPAETASPRPVGGRKRNADRDRTEVGRAVRRRAAAVPAAQQDVDPRADAPTATANGPRLDAAARRGPRARSTAASPAVA